MKKTALFLTVVLIAVLGISLMKNIRNSHGSALENDGDSMDMTNSTPPELEDFISEYEQQVVPIGTLVKIEGRFEHVTIPKGAKPDAKPMVHHSGDYQCIFPVGVSNKIYYRSKNFSVPRDTGGGVREMSYYDVEVFHNGSEVMELKYGVRNNGGTYRKSHDAYLSATPSWYTIDSATGRVFFPLNAGFNRQTLPEVANEDLHTFEIQKSPESILITASKASAEIHLQMDPSFAIVESEYRSQYSNDRNGTRIVYSDIQSVPFEDRYIYVPHRAEFYTLSGDEKIYSSVNEIREITILHNPEPSEIFGGIIPNGWTVFNRIEDREYQQGETKILRFMKSVLNKF